MKFEDKVYFGSLLGDKASQAKIWDFFPNRLKSQGLDILIYLYFLERTAYDGSLLRQH